jgi:predicted membrane channel-forming protein YqfA (hemolysin III family)
MRRVPITYMSSPEYEMPKLRTRNIAHDVEIGIENETENEPSSATTSHTPRKPIPPMTCLCCFRQPLRLCTISEVPSWMARPHILTGYRPDLSFSQCVKSLVYLHNETGNIWSHAIGCVLVFYFMSHLASYEDGYIDYDHHHTYQLLEAMELIPSRHLIIQCFLSAAALCLFGSSVYHAGNCCQDEETCALLLRGDVSGIAILIASSFLPGVYFGFACFPHLQQLYLMMACFLLCLGLGVSLADCCKRTSSSSTNKNKGTDHHNGIALLQGIKNVSVNFDIGMFMTEKVSKSEEQQLDDTNSSSEDALVLPFLMNQRSSNNNNNNDNNSSSSKAILSDGINLGSSDYSDGEFDHLNGGSFNGSPNSRRRMNSSTNNNNSSNNNINHSSREWLHRLRMVTFCSFVCLGLVVAIHWSMLVASEARMVLLPRVSLLFLLLFCLFASFFQNLIHIFFFCCCCCLLLLLWTCILFSPQCVSYLTVFILCSVYIKQPLNFFFH